MSDDVAQIATNKAEMTRDERFSHLVGAVLDAAQSDGLAKANELLELLPDEPQDELRDALRRLCIGREIDSAVAHLVLTFFLGGAHGD